MFGGGHHLGVVLMGLKPGASSAALAAHVQAEEKEEVAEAEALLPKPALLASDLNLDEAVAPEIAELLLGDPAGSTPLQLRHELRLLRDLISAERQKLHMIQHGKPLVSDLEKQAMEASPSGDTWTAQRLERPRTAGVFRGRRWKGVSFELTQGNVLSNKRARLLNAYCTIKVNEIDIY